ncbi:uncharacterized protein LOC129872416 [Solanum dulcamara]|uniref:uncharacterized protein LOC129872416 n=1 Tax=Solanum dulcamara TaxID=45834 RepID=UPI00248542E8|nr:uncharacterized protein LOC129872416 [Solanum dulcamara]
MASLRDMSIHGSNAGSLQCQNNDIGNMNDVNVDQMDSAEAIRLPPTVGNAIFHVTLSIKQLGVQLGQISAYLNLRHKGGLRSDTMVNPKNDNAKYVSILTRSGSKDKAFTFESDELVEELNNEASDEVNNTPMIVDSGVAQGSNMGIIPLVVPTKPLPKVKLLFPQQLKKKDEDVKFQKFLSVFKTLSINLLLVDMLLEIPGYSKFMKELVKKKCSIDFDTIEVSHSCIANMSSNVVVKKDDPRAFTILCTIGLYQFVKALCDLGAGINLMPYAIYKQLRLGEPKLTIMQLLMADCSIKSPIGILYNVLGKVDKLIFSSQFCDP